MGTTPSGLIDRLLGRLSVAVAAMLCTVACASVPSQEFGDDLLFRDFENFGDSIEGEGEVADAEPPSYFAARFDDLLDVLSLRGRIGPGLGVRVAATKYVQAAAMALGPSEYGSDLSQLNVYEVGNIGRDVGTWDVRSAETGLFLWYRYDEDVRGLTEETPRWTGGYEERSRTALELSLHAGLIGATATFDPLELIDLLFGIVGLSDWIVADSG